MKIRGAYMKEYEIEYTEGSNNVYKDLGFTDADERLAKAKLAMRINQLIKERGLKQIQAGKILNINQPKVSALMNGRLSGFSMERLIHFLNLLNQDVEIVIKAKRGVRANVGRLRVAFG